MKNLKLPVIDAKKGEQNSEKLVSDSVLGVSVSDILISQAARRFLSNQRKSRAKAKTRGEVHGSSAKVWRQKGTGRARHGDRQAPVFVGGGKAFGPTGGQNYKKDLNKKLIAKSILAVLSEKQKEKKVFLLSDCNFKKTKEAFSLVEKIKEKLSLKRKILFLHNNDNCRKAFTNLDQVITQNVKTLNIFNLLQSEAVLLTEKALLFFTKEQNKENDKPKN